jgi:hypothetical protein
MLDTHPNERYNSTMTSETYSVVSAIRNNPKVLAAARQQIPKGNDKVRDLVSNLFYDGEASSTPDGVWMDDRRIDWSDVCKAL